MTSEEFQDLLTIKKTRAHILNKQMQEKRLIIVVGRGNDKRIKVKF